MGSVKIGTKPAAAAPGKVTTKPAVGKAAEKEVKPRKKREKKEVNITLDADNIPEIYDADGALILGIPPKIFLENLDENQKKDKMIKHKAKGRRLEYMAKLWEHRMNTHNTQADPKAKIRAQYAKMKAKMEAMAAELGEAVEDVE